MIPSASEAGAHLVRRDAETPRATAFDAREWKAIWRRRHG